MTALRIGFFGDSITAGTGDEEYRGWPGRLCAAERARGHDLTLYNLGVRADTSAHVAGRWQAEARARLPAHLPCALVFAFGVNDTAEEAGKGVRVALPETLGHARAILIAARQWRPTLWIGPTPMAPKLEHVSMGTAFRFEIARTRAANAAYAALAGDLDVPYLDLFEPLLDEPRWRAALAAGDGIHPNGDGYTILAARIGAWPAWRRWFD